MRGKQISPPGNNGSSRRRFLAVTGAAAVVALPAAGYSVFSAEEVKLLEALCEQVLPSGQDGPGAREAGVVNYIDRQLSGPLKRFTGAYREGLAGLKAAGFLALSFAERTGWVEEAESGRVPGTPAAFVRMAIDHTMQGFFSDPKHGGNKDRAGWKLLGYTGGGHAH